MSLDRHASIRTLLWGCHFASDEGVARLIERYDGQPLWDEALTLEDGSTEVSPFIVLAERD